MLLRDSRPSLFRRYFDLTEQALDILKLSLVENDKVAAFNGNIQKYF